MHQRVLAEDFRLVRETTDDWQRFSGTTVVVTGAAGFIPAYLIEFFLSLPDPPMIIGIVRDEHRARERFAHYRGNDRLAIRVADVIDEPPVPERCDFVLHAASQASPRFYATDPVGTLASNVFGTRRYLDLARRDGALFFYFSTGDVYGRVAKETIGESDYGWLDPTSVRSCYGESKRMGETMCVSWGSQFDVDTRIVRIFHTYGPGMRLDDRRVFADFVSDVVQKRNIVMLSAGTSVRAYCYLSDALRGYLAVIARGTPATPYNVGNDDAAVSVEGLARVLTSLFPERNLRVEMRERPAGPSYMESPLDRVIPNTTALRSLNWMPHVSIADGFRRTIESYESSESPS